MSSENDDFDDVQFAFRRGDPRPLADWVMHRDLTVEQRKFVAQALCGDVEKIDGRKVKPTSRKILNDYAMLLWLNRMVEHFGAEDQSVKVLKDSNIARKLANKYGYTDSDSVRRLLDRRGTAIKGLLREDLDTMNGKTGHEKK